LPLGNNPRLFTQLGGNWCAQCSEANLVTEMLHAPFYPTTLNCLRLKSKGFVERNSEEGWEGDEIIWSRINRFLPIKTEAILWNKERGHVPLSLIKFPAVLSVDGSAREGYQSHFVYARSGVYEGKKLVNIEIYDPYYDRHFLLYPHYDKGGLIKTVYSIINYELT